MFEKVNPMHPDKVADRIAGAMVDMAYANQERPQVAVEVLAGHGECLIIAESSYRYDQEEVECAVRRISGENLAVRLLQVPQDQELARNQSETIKCGDNGIFKGCPVTDEQRELVRLARELYAEYGADGKYLVGDGGLVICQSGDTGELARRYPEAKVNPIGRWSGGLSVDSGATNRKLGSDMGDAVTGGGLHGKDLSKADVSVNIFAHIVAQGRGEPVEYQCAIGDEYVGGIPYEEIVERAAYYVKVIGGFEKLAEWGLIR